MSRLSRLISALAVAFLFTACGPGASSPLAPGDPSFSGGHSTGANAHEDEETQITTVAADTTDRSGGHSTGGN